MMTKKLQTLRLFRHFRQSIDLSYSKSLRLFQTTHPNNGLLVDDSDTITAKQHEIERFELEKSLKMKDSPNWKSFQYEPKHELAKLAEILTHSGYAAWKPYCADANPFINTSFSSGQGLRHRLRVNDSNGKFVSDYTTEGGKELKFRVGQVVRHKRFGYRGVVIGWDPACYQTFDWILVMHGLQKNRLQDPQIFLDIQDKPHYHVLVDKRYRPNNQITYCMQDNLKPCDESEIEVKHALVDHYFKAQDLENSKQYTPQEALQKLYPYDVEPENEVTNGGEEEEEGDLL